MGSLAITIVLGVIAYVALKWMEIEPALLIAGAFSIAVLSGMLESRGKQS